MTTTPQTEAALSDIGDADREPGDDLAWCERRAAQSLPLIRQAIALPTAAPVGDRERFEAWWRTVQMRTFPKEYDIKRLQDWGSAYKPKALEAWQARAALSAGDAVDAQRYRWLADCNNYEAGLALIIDPKLTEQALGAALDAAMRKDKL